MTRADSAERICPNWLRALRIGVVMLDTRFPRAVGDIGNPATLFGRGLYRQVSGATVGSVIADAPIASAVVQGVEAAACELSALGVDAVITSCGFLQEIQDSLQQHIPVPVVSSALALLPELSLASGERRTGIMTFDASRLVERHLGGPEIGERCVLVGMEHSSHFHAVIAEDRLLADSDQLRSDVLDAAVAMAAEAPAAVILECTNLAPWKLEIEDIVGVPTFDLLDALKWRLRDASVRRSLLDQGASTSASS